MTNPNPAGGSGIRLLLIVVGCLLIGAVVGVNYIAPHC